MAGPEQFRFDELIRRVLDASHDVRHVVADPNARYFGGQLSERTLVPDDSAQFAATRINDWSERHANARLP